MKLVWYKPADAVLGEPPSWCEVLRYYVGCTGKARGGWFVAVVVLDGDKEVSLPYRNDLYTKKEAKALAAEMNEELKNEIRS